MEQNTDRNKNEVWAKNMCMTSIWPEEIGSYLLLGRLDLTQTRMKWASQAIVISVESESERKTIMNVRDKKYKNVCKMFSAGCDELTRVHEKNK